jgi:hypothetical protein
MVMKEHKGVCRTVRRFSPPWLEDAARTVEMDFGHAFEEYGARLAIRPIRISHLYHVGEGVEAALVPRDPKSWKWWGEFEADLEITRRPRLGRRWEDVHTRAEVQSWLRRTAESYWSQLRFGAA